MCNCNKLKNTLEHVREMALLHQKIEKATVYIYINHTTYNYAFGRFHVPLFATILETIEYIPE